jgi:methyl-accepting chemotaxis protein
VNVSVLFLIILCSAGLLLMAAIYARFRNGLTSKIFAIIIPTQIIVAELSFILGNTGADPVLLLTLVPIGVGATVAAMFAIYRLGMRPLVPLTEVMNRIANQHDLRTLPVVSDRRDEIFAVQSAFYKMTDDLRGILAELQSGITSLGASTAEIAATAQQAASTASEQASSVVEVSATVEEIRQASKASADSARSVAKVSESALDTGRRGVDAVADAVRTMSSIASQVQEVAAMMQQFNEKNLQVSEIIDSVNELAEQSNLLAVNASIEAARAGEQGRGFVAVAAEVRSLAEQSKTATKQIQAILSDIRRSGEDLIGAAELSRRKVEDGVRSTDSLRTTITELLGVLEQSSDLAQQIAGGSAQQAAGITQISDAMTQVQQGGKDTAASAKQLQQAVTDLGSLGDRLRRVVTAYNV